MGVPTCNKPAFRQLRQEDNEFKFTVSYTPRVCLKNEDVNEPVSGDLMSSPDLFRHQALTRCTHVQANTQAHKMKVNKGKGKF